MSSESDRQINFGDFTFGLGEKILSRGNERISLAPKVAETLSILLESPGRLLTKDELMERLWPDTVVEERNLAQNIFILRKVFGSGEGKEQFIETVPRRGYRFVGEVKYVNEEFAPSRNGSEHKNGKQKRVRLMPFVIAAIFLATASGLGYFLFLSETREYGKVPASPIASLKRLTDSGRAWFPSVSADGKKIAYVYHSKNMDSVRVQDVASGGVTEVVPPAIAEIGQPEFTPGGGRLIYPARDGGREATVYSVPVSGGRSAVVARNARSEVSVSPNGRSLAFIRFNGETDTLELVTAELDGSDERVIATRTGRKQYRVWGTSPSWSPGADKLVVAAFDQPETTSKSRREYLVEIDVASGLESEIPTPNFNYLGQAIWSSAGSALYTIAQQTPTDAFQIWKIDLKTFNAEKITNDLINYERLSITADGKELVTGARSSFYNIWIYDVEKRSDPVQLTDSIAVRNGFYGIAWTPDGRELIYAQSNDLDPSNLWSVNVESGTERQLTFDESASNRWPSITPDGRSVIYASNRSENWHVWRLDLRDGVTTQLTDGVGESHPLLSPDGQKLIYGSPGDVPKTTWLVDMQGGGPRKILDDSGGPAHFSSDSARLAVNYFDRNEKTRSPWKFGIMPADGSSPPEEIPINSERSIIRWRPDGRAIYFIEVGRSQNNICLYDLQTKRITLVTSFSEMKIVNLAVSQDGRFLAMSRGVSSSDIVKIALQ
ncbi:MAG TPA: winged helix-turn-helix domain-containing protein [Pyrinomonadaceae bacterium]|nr:winged helix-turn-helix domain-containing protein [Pyrinomonadaceae bacterium]HMP64378.1 winged helix-turn-helix domain-containing protein [Pyrinomonadaceae bacterium]